MELERDVCFNRCDRSARYASVRTGLHRAPRCDLETSVQTERLRSVVNLSTSDGTVKHYVTQFTFLCFSVRSGREKKAL